MDSNHSTPVELNKTILVSVESALEFVTLAVKNGTQRDIANTSFVYLMISILVSMVVVKFSNYFYFLFKYLQLGMIKQKPGPGYR